MRFVLKRFSESDLTLFESRFRNQDGDNRQKAINLNRDVFVDVLYPALKGFSRELGARIPVQLFIQGPNGDPMIQEELRPIMAATAAQKNWRLNGGTISDPPGNPRYDGLRKGDLALLAVDDEVTPRIIRMVLVSRASPNDAAVLRALDALLPAPPSRDSMRVLDIAALQPVFDAAPEGHCIRDLLDMGVAEDLEEAALGSAGATRRLRHGRARPRTQEEFQAAKARAEAIGRDGETLVDSYLHRLRSAGTIEDHVWESTINAIHPHDFTILANGVASRRLEVKSTSGSHDRALHISQAEVEFAAEADDAEVELWRVSEINRDGGVLRISTGLTELACKIVDAARSIPPGITPDGWTVDPRLLEWTEPLDLLVADEED